MTLALHNEGAVGIYRTGYVQPESDYELYGLAGENFEAVSPAQVSESPSHEGKELQVAGTCAAVDASGATDGAGYSVSGEHENASNVTTPRLSNSWSH